MAELKTKQNDASVQDFLQTVTDKERRNDCETVLKIMKQVTGEAPKMWGSSIVGFGSYRYKSPKTNRGGDWFITGFSPRKQNLTLYLMPGIGHYKELVQQLGKCKTGGSCLYITKLAGVDLKVLKALVTAAYKKIKEQTD